MEILFQLTTSFDTNVQAVKWNIQQRIYPQTMKKKSWIRYLERQQHIKTKKIYWSRCNERVNITDDATQQSNVTHTHIYSIINMAEKKTKRPHNNDDTMIIVWIKWKKMLHKKAVASFNKQLLNLMHDSLLYSFHSKFPYIILIDKTRNDSSTSEQQQITILSVCVCRKLVE